MLSKRKSTYPACCILTLSLISLLSVCFSSATGWDGDRVHEARTATGHMSVHTHFTFSMPFTVSTVLCLNVRSYEPL